MLNITNENCMELMARYPDKYFELCIIDPPYGIDVVSNVYEGRDGYIGGGGGLKGKSIPVKGKHAKKDWDKQPFTLEQWNEVKRVSKEQIVFGCNYYEGYFSGGGRIVWDKLNFSNDFSDGEIAYYSGHNRVDIVYFVWNGLMKGNTGSRDPRQALRQQGGDLSQKTKRIHPCEKPIGLYKYLLDKYAKPNDKILDCFLGSGSIAIACHDYGFDLTACELDTDYYNAAMKRIAIHTAQLKLF